MTLLQFKPNHVGKRLVVDENKKPGLTKGYIDKWGVFCYEMKPPTEGGDFFNFDHIGTREYQYINFANNPEEQKWILFEIERHTAVHPKYNFLKEEFVLVQTQDPKVNDYMAARPHRFWVKADWVEPYNKNYKSHLGEAKAKLLKNLQRKWGQK